MRVEKILRLRSGIESTREALAGWFLGEGFVSEAKSPEKLRFTRKARSRSFWIARTEDLGQIVEIGLGSREDSTGARVILIWTVDDRRRLSRRIDALWLELSFEALGVYLETGRRDDVTAKLLPLRRLVAWTMASNAVLALLLVVVVGRIADLSPLAIAGFGLGIVLLDAAAIAGFADLLIERLLEVLPQGDREPG